MSFYFGMFRYRDHAENSYHFSIQRLLTTIFTLYILSSSQNPIYNASHCKADTIVIAAFCRKHNLPIKKSQFLNFWERISKEESSEIFGRISRD